MTATAENNSKDIMGLISEIAELAADDDYIYRGEPEHYPKVSSTLYRDYEDEIEAGRSDIEVIQMGVLQEARQYADETDGFEILTQLQHYGGKTNLVDFTTDIHVALFFACNGSFEKDGRVILQRARKVRRRVALHPKHRVISQKSIFVQPPKGFIDPEPGKVISIPKKLKQPILDYLRKYHDIIPKTVYNDLHGFMAIERIHHKARKSFLRGLSWQEQGHHDKAIRLYNKSIRQNPNHTEPYNNRGVAYEHKGKTKKAIKDYTRAIGLDSNNATAYYNRGVAFLMQQKWDKAESDLRNARDRKFNITVKFGEENQSVADFERQHGVEVPGSIKAMLAPQQDASG